MAFPPGKQAPPFGGGGKKVGSKGKARKPGKSAPAQKALRMGGGRGSMRGGGRF